MTDSDSDDDILDNLLANDDETELEKSPNSPKAVLKQLEKSPNSPKAALKELEKSPNLPKAVLKELDYNFLEKITESPEKMKFGATDGNLRGSVDSSDDEDGKYFEKSEYSEAGRGIKELLKHQEWSKNDSLTSKNDFSSFKNDFSSSKNDFSSSKNDFSSSKDDFLTSKNTLPKSQSQIDVKEKDNSSAKPKNGLTNWLNKPADVYTDPIFGLRIITPLISSAELKERMRDRRAITVSKVKEFLSTQDQSQDWVIAGVLIHRSATKKSQNGNQYCIWQISDLSEKVLTFTLFLFSGAFKGFWKTSEGTVIGILNPSVMESRSDKAEATLSVDNPQKIMILGNSRDMGRCKSVKKSGEPCTNIVNTNRCEYCIYHVKQEYHKASRRTDLQTDSNTRRFGNIEKTGKFGGIHSQGNGINQLNMLAIPAKRNLKMEKKDSERLALLSGQTSGITCKTQQTVKEGPVKEGTQATKYDLEKFNKNRGWSFSRSALSLSSISSLSNSPSQKNRVSSPSPSENSQKNLEKSNKFDKSLTSLVPRLGSGVTGDTIDFSEPITKKHISAAKMNAIKWAKEKGGIKQSNNVNKVRESKEKMQLAAVKRKREEEEEKGNEDKETKKLCSTSDRFKELIEVGSAHADLIEQADDNEKEKYFNKLEAKERMEEKMMNTFKVDCKAVKCLICKYTSFSASDICKEKRHPLRVIDAVKSFFKCGDCGNRTVSLDKLPSFSCQKCSSSKWLRAAMMNEKTTSIADNALSIRGGEEKFVGSDVKNSSINLLVPDND